MRFGVKSDKGMVRETNEDSYNVIAGYSGIPVTFVIADGMGGHNSGEIASKMAVDSVSNSILKMKERFENQEDVSGILRAVIHEANTNVYAASNEHNENHGMGTTLIVAIVCQRTLYIGHVGDSRVYLVRNNSISQITTDHSFIEELVRNGTLTREEAENHPKKNIITRALGCSENIEVDTYSTDIKEDDIFVLCTDGLSNMLSNNEILNIVMNIDDPELASSQLLDVANTKGGEDNITVVVFKN